MIPETPRLVQILLVEDNPEEVLLTQETPKGRQGRQPGARPRTASARCASRARRASTPRPPKPDLILLDLNLPRKDGREVLTELKADPDLRRIPVIVLTTSASDRDMLQAYHNSVNAYIRKPVSLDRFIDVVNSIDDFWLGVVSLPGGLRP